MSDEKPLPLKQALPMVLRDMWRWIKREPWMAFLPILLAWRFTTTAEERKAHLKRVLSD